MKAAVVHNQDIIKYEEFPKPEILSDEILIRVRKSGVCGSDLPRVLGKGARYYPIVLGHEFSGEIAEIGQDVKGFKLGDRVSGAPLLPCHSCIDCQRGDHAQCKNYSFVGSRLPGSWAEYIKLPALNAINLSPKVSFIEGAFMEPITVALHGLFLMNFIGGHDLAIIGMGTIGLLTLQCAKAMGAKNIYAFDIDDERLAVAKEYGAYETINTGQEGFLDRVWELTDSRGFENVVETAGVEFTEKLSLELAANKANLMFIGTPSSPITLEPREFEHINRKELLVRGSWMSYSAPFPGKEWELAAYYLDKGLVRVDKLIDRIVPLSKAPEVFEDFKIPGKIKGKVLFKV